MKPNKGWIQTFTGKKFYPLDPDPNTFDIRDQAAALSKQCRYLGHVQRFYSVAEHAVRMSREAELRKYPLMIQQQCLVHDNTEAYLGDMPRPLKLLEAFNDYNAAEERLQHMLFDWLYLEPEIHPAVKALDMEILGTEVNALKCPIHPDWPATLTNGKLADPWPHVDPLNIGWMPWKAENVYLARFLELWGGPISAYYN